MTEKPRIIDFRYVQDPRGGLAFSEIANELPFEVKRVYWISNMPHLQRRGGHAHRTETQLIICVQGSAKVKLTSSSGELLELELSAANQGLLIPPMWWGEMEFFDNAVLVGMSSHLFDEKDYIRNRSEFK